MLDLVCSVSFVHYSEDGEAKSTVFALHLAMSEHEQIGKAIWEDFVPAALDNGQLQTKPDPIVVGKGLESVQHALDVQMKGVSARKVIIDFQ